MNLTEIEAKVREATNNEPWGASTTLMSQISAATYNYKEREEIINFIFRRFTEKSSCEWRQIYKSLQLLDYLIKNGSERVIDCTRANVSLIQMLKSFHYIDSKGRDQGINIKNKTKSLITLLEDDNLLRAERKKAKLNAKKFSSSNSAFGGNLLYSGKSYFDKDPLKKVYGDGSVYSHTNDFHFKRNINKTFETDEYDDNETFSQLNYSNNEIDIDKTNRNSKYVKSQDNVDLLNDLILDLNFESDQKKNNSNSNKNDHEFNDFQLAPITSEKKSSFKNLDSLYNSQNNSSDIQRKKNLVPDYNNQSIIDSKTNRQKEKTSEDIFSSLFTSAIKKSESSSGKNQNLKPEKIDLKKGSMTNIYKTKNDMDNDSYCDFQDTNPEFEDQKEKFDLSII